MNQRYSRRPRRWRKRPFDDLSPHNEATATMLVANWRARRGRDVPGWLYPKLVERAYKLVEYPSTPYKLAGTAGGKACQRKMLREGRVGPEHPIHKARLKILAQRRAKM
jgi:hypothetical protein